jgi:hypothetical protein
VRADIHSLFVEHVPGHSNSSSSKGSKLKANDIVPCLLCDDSMKLKEMHAHIGAHILPYFRRDGAEVVDEADQELFDKVSSTPFDAQNRD